MDALPALSAPIDDLDLEENNKICSTKNIVSTPMINNNENNDG